MSEWFGLDMSEMETLQTAMEEYAGAAGPLIDEVLRGEGAEEIKKEITPLLPISGRTWKGKAKSASAVMPQRFTQENSSLSVTIKASGTYHYLYFPDDGSNTKRHIGNQEFMRRGAENASDRILDLCIGKLTENF